MNVYVLQRTEEYTDSYYVSPNGGFYVRYDWVPDKMMTAFEASDGICQAAADGDQRVRRFIEGAARRAIERQLLKDLRHVIGPGWARALEVLVAEESMKEAEHEEVKP